MIGTTNHLNAGVESAVFFVAAGVPGRHHISAR
jgi:hypothetical protein